MEIGDIVIVIGCFTNSRGENEHPAIVTRVWSETEIDCTIFLSGSRPNIQVEENLHHESTTRSSKRFRFKT